MHLDTRSNTDVKKLLLGYSNWATKYLEYHHKGLMEIPSISTDNLPPLRLPRKVISTDLGNFHKPLVVVFYIGTSIFDDICDHIFDIVAIMSEYFIQSGMDLPKL